LSTSRVFKIFLDFTQFTIKERKGGLLKKNNKTFQLENGKSYKCVQYKGKKANIVIRKRNDEAKIGESESIINTKFIKSDSNSSPFAQFTKNNDSGKASSSDSIKRRNTETSNSDDESDSDLSDSDNDSNYSDDEESTTNKKLPRQDSKSSNASELINSMNSKKNDDSNAINNTVTYTVNKNGETKTYEKSTELEDTLDWEQAYCDKYYQTNDVMQNFLNNKEDGETKRLNHMDIVKLDLKKITEEEYFDPKSTKPMHMGRIMNIVEEKKIYKHKIKLWMAKDSSNFPLVANDIKPIAELAVMLLLDQIKQQEGSDNLDKSTYDYITKELIERAQKKNIFPVKISKFFFFFFLFIIFFIIKIIM